MRLAVDGPDERQTTFVEVTAFAELGRNCGVYLSQGHAVAVAGRLAYSEWEDDDGRRRSKHEVSCARSTSWGGGRREDRGRSASA